MILRLCSRAHGWTIGCPSEVARRNVRSDRGKYRRPFGLVRYNAEDSTATAAGLAFKPIRLRSSHARLGNRLLQAVGLQKEWRGASRDLDVEASPSAGVPSLLRAFLQTLLSRH
jgi:hypothetical protein